MDIAPLAVGYTFGYPLTLNADEIVAGARFLNDTNPLHNDAAFASASRFGGLLACGPHVSGLHACMLPSHCTELGLDVVGTVFTVRYASPVFADVSHDLAWTVESTTPHRFGALVAWTGTVTASSTERVCIEATGELLVVPRG